MSEAPARVVVLTGAVIAQNGQEVPLVDIPGKGSKRRVTLVAAAVALGGYLTTAAPTAGAAAGFRGPWRTRRRQARGRTRGHEPHPASPVSTQKPWWGVTTVTSEVTARFYV